MTRRVEKAGGKGQKDIHKSSYHILHRHHGRRRISGVCMFVR